MPSLHTWTHLICSETLCSSYHCPFKFTVREIQIQRDDILSPWSHGWQVSVLQFEPRQVPCSLAQLFIMLAVLNHSHLPGQHQWDGCSYKNLLVLTKATNVTSLSSLGWDEYKLFIPILKNLILCTIPISNIFGPISNIIGFLDFHLCLELRESFTFLLGNHFRLMLCV